MRSITKRRAFRTLFASSSVMRIFIVACGAALFFVLGYSQIAHGQSCTGYWTPVAGVNPNASNFVVLSQVNWDPDGPGPLPPQVAIGGAYSLQGPVSASNVSAWNPQTGEWSALGSGVDNGVRALAVMPNGDLAVSGDFQRAGGGSAYHIARWNGAVWSPLGTGIDLSIGSLQVAPNGDLYAGGTFDLAGTTVVRGITRWTGTSWSGVGTHGRALVYAMLFLPNGDLIAQLDLLHGLYRWNGTTWTRFGVFNGEVRSLALMPNGDILVGGEFSSVDGVIARRIARWNGMTWGGLGTGLSGGALGPRVFALAVLPTGDVVAAGTFSSAGGQPANNIARWDGSAWFPLGTGTTGDVYALTVLPNNDLLVGGEFVQAGGLNSYSLARYTFGGACAADFNCSGASTAQDIFDFLAAWFALDTRADVNSSDGINVQDIFDFVMAWLEGC